MKKFLDILASFGLCCALLACLFCLTLFGTLYQVDHGLYEAKRVYFSSWFLDGGGEFVLPFPFFPGGMTCMGLLSLNRLLGGLVRIKLSKRTLGVVVIHVGIACLLGAGLVKMVTAEEGNLRLVEGQQSNFFQSYTRWEVAIWPMEQGRDVHEYVIQDDFLSDLSGDRSRTFHAPGLPFELELSSFVKNARVEPKGPMWESVGPTIDGYGILEMDSEKEAEFNVAALHVRVGDQQGILWAVEQQPWTVHTDDGHYAITLRHERYEMPFEVRLLDFIKEEHPGMSMAKAFRSHVIKIDEDGEERVLIQMNEPLRQDNLVLFQSSYGSTRRGDEYSVFSVVRNVSDKWPEYSMWVITVGMVLAFGRKLIGFVRSQAKRRPAAGGAA
jgi:hypothetical protein